MDSEKIILGLAIAVRIAFELVNLQGKKTSLDGVYAFLFLAVGIYELFHRGIGWISIFFLAIGGYHLVKILWRSSHQINRESE